MARDKSSRQRAQQKGHKGEGRAALYLRLKGYRIMERRYKTPVGEADLIVRKGQTLAFVEVKARENYRDGVEAITYRQQQRVLRAAKSYLAANPGLAELDIRFDAFIVLPRLKIKHIPGAWRETVR